MRRVEAVIHALSRYVQPSSTHRQATRRSTRSRVGATHAAVVLLHTCKVHSEHSTPTVTVLNRLEHAMPERQAKRHSCTLSKKRFRSRQHQTRPPRSAVPPTRPRPPTHSRMPSTPPPRAQRPAGGAIAATEHPHHNPNRIASNNHVAHYPAPVPSPAHEKHHRPPSRATSPPPRATRHHVCTCRCDPRRSLRRTAAPACIMRREKRPHNQTSPHPPQSSTVRPRQSRPEPHVPLPCAQQFPPLDRVHTYLQTRGCVRAQLHTMDSGV